VGRAPLKPKPSPTEPIETNGDPYKAIADLLGQKKDQSLPSLERYLLNLVRRASHMAHKESLSLEEFFLLLRDSFDGPGDAPEVATIEAAVPQFHEWKAAVAKQIQDLREMAENRQLEDPHRYFGIVAPSGERWYNFDPCAYIECGVAGTLGGLSDQLAPGLDSEGRAVKVPMITWVRFSQFVWAGRQYE
jgi:hypothetical protein